MASVFAAIPPKENYKTTTSEFVNFAFKGVSVPSFIEGPAFDRDGNLWLVDIPWGRILRVDSHGTVDVVVEYDGQPNGLDFHRDGRLFIADHKYGIVTFDPATGQIAKILTRSEVGPFLGVNDLMFGRNGDLYFTDQGQTGLHDPSGCLYRLRSSGRLDRLLSNVPSPNGLALSEDEDAVFLAVTRDNAIWRVPLTSDGSVRKVGAFIRMSAGIGPDGLAIDEEGGLAACHVGLGAVWLFDGLGQPKLRIQSPTGLLTTNCAFGGKHKKQLFITESKTGTILVADVPAAGRSLFLQSK